MGSTVVETTRLDGEPGWVRRPWYDLRPIAVASLYLVLYFALDLGIGWLGSSVAVDYRYLSAGLGFGLLLAFGLRYAPVVLAAHLADNFWIHPPSAPALETAVRNLALALILILAAALLRKLTGGSELTLKHGREAAKFLVAALAAASALAVVMVIPQLPRLSPHSGAIFALFQGHLIGFATGLVALAPMVLIHAGPGLETLVLGFGSGRPVPIRTAWMLRLDRATALFVLTYAAGTVLVFWLVFSKAVTGELPILLLFSGALIWAAVKQGLAGLSAIMPLFTGGLMLGIWRTASEPSTAALLHAILLAAMLNAFVIGTAVTALRTTNHEVDRRDAILDAVGYAAQQFLGKGAWESGIQDVLRRLGEATSVSRVFIVDRRGGEGGGPRSDTWLHEWAAPGLSMEENDRRMLYLLRSQIIEEHASALSLGQACLCRSREIDPKKREMLEALGVQSTVIVPLFVDRQWWGSLGLERYLVDRAWTASEIGGLRVAGQILGTLISSIRIEQRFRQMTGNIQAVFWISSPDGQAKHYVSPGYEEIWGRSCASLESQPASWLEALHQEDQGRVREALVKQVWGEYDEEYRVVRPDGSHRWVRDRAFPVRDQTGQVYRIVGLAEDITKQKKAEEQLRAATVLLSSLIDHLQSGVLVEDEARRITHVNQAFSSMFGVPVPPHALFGVDSRLLFVHPQQFATRIEQIIKDGVPLLGEELHWQDRVFIRNYLPLSVGEEYHYHLWQYQDVTVSRHAEEQIKSSLKEKEVLLKEIHHRVKNNLQIICSLLNLQAGEIADPKACQTFKESQDRVKAMALIHERLYQSRDLAGIDFAGYVRSLTGHLLRSYRINSNTIQLKLEVDSVPMSLDVAIPCGLIINELVSNAMKYAFPDGRTGAINVCFSENGDQSLRLTVRDDGIGFPAGVNPESSESLGLRLVRSLVEQLGGSLAYSNQNGFRCEIRIPHVKVENLPHNAARTE